MCYLDLRLLHENVEGNSTSIKIVFPFTYLKVILIQDSTFFDIFHQSQTRFLEVGKFKLLKNIYFSRPAPYLKMKNLNNQVQFISSHMYMYNIFHLWLDLRRCGRP